MVQKDEVWNKVEFIQDRLGWQSCVSPPKGQTKAFYFTIDKELQYMPFINDFGPLSIGQVHRYITRLYELLEDKSNAGKKIYHITSMNTNDRANSAWLICCYMMIVMKQTPEEAWKPFEACPGFTAFRDASYGPCSYQMTILHALKGLYQGIMLGWYDFKKFNLRYYEFYEKVENGDLNWIIPGKFLAFSGPSNVRDSGHGYQTLIPEDYVPLFKTMKIEQVIRLNKSQYDREKFTKKGIKHLELYFQDGSAPSDEVVRVFLEVVEATKGAVAIHCKAGLGRTGTLIAQYAMKHYKFKAEDFIGYIRAMRPGSILGPQQHFLCEKEAEFHKLSEKSEIYNNQSKEIQDFTNQKKSEYKFTMNEKENKILKDGDIGQGQSQLHAKGLQSSKNNSPGK